MCFCFLWPFPSIDVEFRTTNPQCCIECNDPIRCNEPRGRPYCLQMANGQEKVFSNYKALFEFACVNNLPAPRDKIFANSCPSGATVPPVPTAAPFPRTTLNSLSNTETTEHTSWESTTEQAAQAPRTTKTPPSMCLHIYLKM